MQLTILGCYFTIYYDILQIAPDMYLQILDREMRIWHN